MVVLLCMSPNSFIVKQIICHKHHFSKQNAILHIQRRNEVRWRLGQEASLAPPCFNLLCFRSKFTALKEVFVTFLGLFGTPAVIRQSHSDLAPRELHPHCSPSLCPCSQYMCLKLMSYHFHLLTVSTSCIILFYSMQVYLKKEKKDHLISAKTSPQKRTGQKKTLKEIAQKVYRFFFSKSTCFPS